MNKIAIINTGGTFSKYTNKTFDKLILDNKRLSKELIKTINIENKNNIIIENIINKDSLDIDNNDRKLISDVIFKYNFEDNINKFIIIHGTDTMIDTAKFINKELKQLKKEIQIVFVGSMIPYSQDKSEPSFNFGVGYSFVKFNNKKGIFISMNGHLRKWNKIFKDKKNLIFKKK